MNKNFVVGQSNELIQNGNIYDLHNSFLFSSFVFEGKSRRLQLRFDPTSNPDRSIPAVILVFSELRYLELSPDFGKNEVSGLDEVGYKHPNDFDYEWLLTQNQAGPNDHLLFRFDEGDFIRIYSKYADLQESNAPTKMRSS